MPTIYRRTEHITELNGQVRNGLAVIAHSPKDVEALEGAVEAVERLPGDPLANLYRVLNNAGKSPDMWPWREGVAAQALAQRGTESPSGPDTPLHSLRVSLALSREMWRRQGRDIQSLSAALVLPRPGRRAVLETRRPALVLDHGSIRARVLAAGGRVRDFGVALFPVARSKRRANLVEALRAHAIEAQGGNAVAVALPRLETLQASQLDGKTGVVIFLHGLMSTDVGTFDALVRAIKQDGVGGNWLLVSWPHDTLTSIASNADDLAVLIEEQLGQSSLPIAFVGHSRGGLVARRTVVELLKVAKERWLPRLRGLVTFGTPHHGAELAEAGDEMIGKLLLVYTIATQAGAVPLVDALWTIKDSKKLAGVSDLRPRGGKGEFLHRLRKAEGKIVGQVGAMPLPLWAVGGSVKDGGLFGMLSGRYLGGDSHDLIVALSSTMPNGSRERQPTTCNHFGYFDEREVTGSAGTAAITFLLETMVTAAPPAATRPDGRIPISKPLVYKKGATPPGQDAEPAESPEANAESRQPQRAHT